MARPQVWVDDDSNAERARAIIDAYHLSVVHVGTLKCPACGEDNPASFELCWSCGAGLEK